MENKVSKKNLMFLIIAGYLDEICLIPSQFNSNTSANTKHILVGFNSRSFIYRRQ
jgi:hypothetical protein